MHTVENLDIKKFMGTWYVISIIPNFFEKGCEDAYDLYELNSDGTISISYHAIKNGKSINLKQKAIVIDDINNSRWEIKFIKPFIPFFRVPYKVIILDDDYEYMVIGYPNNKYGWIMSRNKNMDEQLYQNILNILENDFDYNKIFFKKVKHNYDN